MKFIDEISITIRAGSGGDGHVSFLHSHLNPLSGPDGGNGGRGGSVYFRGNSQLNSFYKFSTKKNWFAPDGENGKRGLKTGRSGSNLYIEVPLGTIIYMASEDSVDVPVAEIVEENQLFLASKGGQGGQGNSAFASSVNRTPRYAQNGVKAKALRIRLELIVIADAGLLGLPNAGKSTLLNSLSNANSRSGDYAFTTLTPQLGVVTGSRLKKKILLADLPGIIEKASENRGLGLRFLKHVKRCKVLILVVDSTSEQPLRDLQILQKELAATNYEESQKEQLVVWNKIDLLPVNSLNQIRQTSQKLKKTHSFFISALKSENLEDLVGVIDNIVEHAKSSHFLLPEKLLHKSYDFTSDPVGLQIRKLKNSYWKVSGPYIERVIHQTRTSSLQKEISKLLSVESARSFLLRAGVKSGDVLLINNEEYFWNR